MNQVTAKLLKVVPFNECKRIPKQLGLPKLPLVLIWATGRQGDSREVIFIAEGVRPVPRFEQTDTSEYYFKGRILSKIGQSIEGDTTNKVGEVDTFWSSYCRLYPSDAVFAPECKNKEYQSQ